LTISRAYTELLTKHYSLERALAEFAIGTQWADAQAGQQLLALQVAHVLWIGYGSEGRFCR